MEAHETPVDPNAVQHEAPEQSPAAEPVTEPTQENVLESILQSQKEQRAAIQSLQENLHRQYQPAPRGVPASELSAKERHNARLEELAGAPFYCPGCGNTYGYMRECTGRGEAPHPPILVVSTDEVKNAPDPEGDPAAYREWQQGHTAAPAGE